MVSANFLSQKAAGKKYFFSNFWFQEMPLKGRFFQLLTSKIYDKIWHCFKIFCSFCVSETFGISPVKAFIIHFKHNTPVLWNKRQGLVSSY